MFQIEGTACAEGLWPLGVSELKEGLTGRGSDGEMRQRGKHRADLRGPSRLRYKILAFILRTMRRH